ncbi:MAG: ribonuclease HI [Phormidesmis sp.]
MSTAEATAQASVKEIYTDGACSGNPGPGGWGTLIEFADGQTHELGGRDKATTNNRMEMQAAIAALEYLQKFYGETNSDGGAVILHTDSEYLKNGITRWIQGWKRKGWKTSAGKPVLNKDLWQQLDTLTQSLSGAALTIDWRYVRGHTGNLGNERCDAIARAFSHSTPISLKQYKKAPDKAVSQTATRKAAANETEGSYVAESSSLETDAKVDTNGHRDDSENATKINTDLMEAPSSIPTLRFYETEEDPQKGQQPDMVTPSDKPGDSADSSKRNSRIERLTDALKTLQVTDELAKQGYLITSAELADLMDVNASAVTSRGDYWAWRNWSVSRIRREGNQILWQLERIDE